MKVYKNICTHFSTLCFSTFWGSTFSILFLFQLFWRSTGPGRYLIFFSFNFPSNAVRIMPGDRFVSRVMIIFGSYVDRHFANIQYFNVYGGIWRYIKLFGGIWNYMKVYGGIWRHLSIYKPTCSTLFFFTFLGGDFFDIVVFQLFGGPLFRHCFFSTCWGSTFWTLFLFQLFWRSIGPGR